MDSTGRALRVSHTQPHLNAHEKKRPNTIKLKIIVTILKNSLLYKDYYIISWLNSRWISVDGIQTTPSSNYNVTYFNGLGTACRRSKDLTWFSLICISISSKTFITRATRQILHASSGIASRRPVGTQPTRYLNLYTSPEGITGLPPNAPGDIHGASSFESSSFLAYVSSSASSLLLF